MDSKKVITCKKEVLENLSNRQLKNVFILLRSLLTGFQDSQMYNKLDELETNYKYMLHYQFEDVVDPEKDVIYNGIIRSLYEYIDDISDNLLTESSSNIFYERKRISTSLPTTTLANLKHQMKEVSDTLSVLDLSEDLEEKSKRRRELAVRQERIEADIFNMIFISPRIDDMTEKEYLDFLNDVYVGSREKCLFISALTLNLMHRFDARKISILMDVCLLGTVEVSQRAIVGLIIILQMYDVRWDLYAECKSKLEVISENDLFRQSVLRIIIQLIRSRETEEISRKMNEEIIPEMMKFSSLAKKKLNMQDLMGESDFAEKNPEWKKELEDSGLAHKLQEYSNLQTEGADVFHSTFSSLKIFPFFNELSNWFLPFDTFYSELQPLTSDEGGLSNILNTAILKSDHMCDSDKYSFAFSVLQIPTSQKELILQRLDEQSDQMKELQNEAAALNPKITSEIISNQYIQNLYRFFKLHPYRNNFFDIFKLRLNFYDKKSIAPLISSESDMLKIATYCFDKNFFQDALPIFERLVNQFGIDESAIWQKIGYCKQMLSDLRGALNAYLRAELLAPENSWILKRIAQIYKLLKEPAFSIEYYQRAAQLNPGNISTELNIGHCYLELGEYEKALNTYFKVELLETKTNKAWRPIAWTAFLLRKFEMSQKYYRLLLSENPTEHDFLNAGHVELCLGDKKTALNLYLQAVKKSESFDHFEKLLNEDKEHLIQLGVDIAFFPLLLDELRYKLD